jgi:phosphoglycolate phosphatase
MIKALLLDFDGTLVDTAPDFLQTMQTLCAAHNIAPPSDDAIRDNVSNGARALVCLAFGIDTDNPALEPLRQELLEHYEVALQTPSTALYPGMTDVLSYCEQQGLPWGIVTNKPRRYTEILVTALALKPGAVVCPDDVAQTKPHPEPMLKAAAALNVAASDCLYAGDHERDIIAGHAAGMQTVAARYGYIDADEDIASWKAHATIDSAAELLPLLSTSKETP